MNSGFYVRADGAREIVVDPASDKDYAIAWTDWLNEDVISTSTWAVNPTGPTLYSDSINAAPVTIDGVEHPIGAVTTVWIRTLVAGAKHRITNHIVTGTARTDERSFWLVVRDL